MTIKLFSHPSTKSSFLWLSPRWLTTNNNKKSNNSQSLFITFVYWTQLWEYWSQDTNYMIVHFFSNHLFSAISQSKNSMIILCPKQDSNLGPKQQYSDVKIICPTTCILYLNLRYQCFQGWVHRKHWHCKTLKWGAAWR